jgi:hypothetical protein
MHDGPVLLPVDRFAKKRAPGGMGQRGAQDQGEALPLNFSGKAGRGYPERSPGANRRGDLRGRLIPKGPPRGVFQSRGKRVSMGLREVASSPIGESILDKYYPCRPRRGIQPAASALSLCIKGTCPKRAKSATETRRC